MHCSQAPDREPGYKVAPAKSVGLRDFAGLWSGGVHLVLLRPGGRAAASGGLLEAVTVAVRRAPPATG